MCKFSFGKGYTRKVSRGSDPEWVAPREASLRAERGVKGIKKMGCGSSTSNNARLAKCKSIIIFDIMKIQKSKIFLFKSHDSMMLLLILDVFFYRFQG